MLTHLPTSLVIITAVFGFVTGFEYGWRGYLLIKKSPKVPITQRLPTLLGLRHPPTAPLRSVRGHDGHPDRWLYTRTPNSARPRYPVGNRFHHGWDYVRRERSSCAAEGEAEVFTHVFVCQGRGHTTDHLLDSGGYLCG